MPKEKFTVPQTERVQLVHDLNEDVHLVPNGIPEDQVAVMEEQVVMAEAEVNDGELVISDNTEDEDDGVIFDNNPNTST